MSKQRPRTVLCVLFGALLVGVSMAVWGCGGELQSGGDEPNSEGANSESVVSSTDIDDEREEVELPVPVGTWALVQAARHEVEEMGGVASFPHASHAEVACMRCHQSLTGHSTHTSVECGGCHGRIDDARPQMATCLACHHDPDVGIECGRCHSIGEAGPIEVTQVFRVAGTVTERQASFQHGLHERLRCASCHQVLETDAVEPACSSCHERHHTASADCTVCHPASTLESHDSSAHLGCDGAGCHDSQRMAELTGLGALGPSAPRTDCLICHQDQQGHGQGRACAPCHFPMGGSLEAGLFPEEASFAPTGGRP